jgi:sulfide dehydrogenase cytochrome subunit
MASMHSFRTVLCACVCAAGVLASTAAGGEEVSRAALLSLSCTGCHGPDGHSPGAIPSINGKSADFISMSLKMFRSGDRPATVMGRHALGYTDEGIELIA